MNSQKSELENHRVQVFNNAGNFSFSFGTMGSGDGEFAGARGLFVENDLIYVADGNDRVQVFQIVPEPSSLALMITVTAGFGMTRRRRLLMVSIDSSGYKSSYGKHENGGSSVGVRACWSLPGRDAQRLSPIPGLAGIWLRWPNAILVESR